MPRTVRLLLVMLLTLAGAATAGPTAFATPTGCAVTWGSLPKTGEPVHGAPMVAVRAGSHPCWDRVVFEVEGEAAGYSIRYVPEVRDDGSGDVLPVPGGARLQVLIHHPAYDEQGNPTLTGGVDVRGFPTLRSVVRGASFEGDTTFGVGVRAQLPFRVFTLDGPGSRSRIVLDVAHSWS